MLPFLAFFYPRNDLLFASGHLGRFEKKLSLGYVGYVVARAVFLPEESRPSLVGLIFLVVLVMNMNRNIPFCQGIFGSLGFKKGEVPRNKTQVRVEGVVFF